MKLSDAAPDVLEIVALSCARTANRHHRQAALGETGSDCTPPIPCPFLVGEHWCRVDHSVLAAVDNVRRRCRSGAYQFRNPRDFQGVGKAQHLLDAVELVGRWNASVQCDTF